MGIAKPTDAEDPKRAFRIHLERLRASGRRWRFHGTTRASLHRWQASTRRKLLNLLCPQGFTKVPLNLRRSTIAETELYRHEKIWYDTLPDISVPAALLIPKAAPLPAPAVLCPPGHGNGVSQILDANSEYKGYPIKLAELGFVCLVPELLGFGERTDPNSNNASHSYYYMSLILLGQSAIGVYLWELQRAIDVLQCLPEVDASRIGCWGLSLGGEMTMFTAAADTRIKAACISGFFTSYESTFLDNEHCGCGYIPGMALYMEHVDIASLIAPRTLRIEAGKSDPLFPLEAAEAAFNQLREVYRIAGAPDTVQLHVFDGEHEISGDAGCRWFQAQLGNRCPVV